MKMRRRKGMKIGAKHNWKYRHLRSIDNGKQFKIYQIKRRNRPSPYGSGMPISSQLIWNIRAKEDVRKTKGGYLVTLRGYKGQGAFKLPNKNWVRNRRRKKYARSSLSNFGA